MSWSVFHIDRWKKIWTCIRKGQHLFWKERGQEAKDWPDQWRKPTNPYSSSYIADIHQLPAMWQSLFAIRQPHSILMKGKCWHRGGLAGWPAIKSRLTRLRQSGSLRAPVLSRAILHSYPECSLLFPCPQTFSVIHTLRNPHSFLLPTSSWKNNLILYW